MNLDAKEFNRMFSEYRDRYIRFAQSYLKDSFLAEDFYVDSMMGFWQNRDSLPQDTNVPAYVLRMLRNRCIDHLRRCRLNEAYCQQKGKAGVWDLDFRISCLERFVPEDVFRHEIEGILRSAMADMSEDSRKIFIMSRREGKSVKEIAQVMGISEKGVEYHITKVTKILRVKLKDYVPMALLLFLIS